MFALGKLQLFCIKIRFGWHWVLTKGLSLIVVVVVAIYFKRQRYHIKMNPFTSPVKYYFLIDLEKRGNESLEKPFYECFIITAKKGNIPS